LISILTLVCLSAMRVQAYQSEYELFEDKAEYQIFNADTQARTFNDEAIKELRDEQRQAPEEEDTQLPDDANASGDTLDEGALNTKLIKQSIDLFFPIKIKLTHPSSTNLFRVPSVFGVGMNFNYVSHSRISYGIYGNYVLLDLLGNKSANIENHANYENYKFKAHFYTAGVALGAWGEKLVTHLGLGFGQTQLSCDNQECETNIENSDKTDPAHVYELFVSLKWRIIRHWSVNLGYRYVATTEVRPGGKTDLNNSLNLAIYTLGMGFYF
jgi:opacity protein-like surface antigen